MAIAVSRSKEKFGSRSGPAQTRSDVTFLWNNVLLADFIKREKGMDFERVFVSVEGCRGVWLVGRNEKYPQKYGCVLILCRYRQTAAPQYTFYKYYKAASAQSVCIRSRPARPAAAVSPHNFAINGPRLSPCRPVSPPQLTTSLHGCSFL